MSGRIGTRWAQARDAVAWTAPTSTEVGTVAKSGLAAGVAWWLARTVTAESLPTLAALTSLVVVQVSVRASFTTALQRSLAVVLGVVAALAIGDALALNGVTVAVVVVLALGVAQLGLRLPRAAARQVPISALVVLGAVATDPRSFAWRRAVDTLLGAAVGLAVSFALPASRLVDARQTLDRLADGISGVLASMGTALAAGWTAEDSREWRRSARIVRQRLVEQAEEAVGSSQEAARWNVRDRRHVAELRRYEEALPRFERTAIGAWTLARGLDDQARLESGQPRAMAAAAELLGSLATAVRTLADEVLGRADAAAVERALDVVRQRRARCAAGAARRARDALAATGDPTLPGLESDWLGYAALLVQVDRIAADLQAHLAPSPPPTV